MKLALVSKSREAPLTFDRSHSALTGWTARIVAANPESR